MGWELTTWLALARSAQLLASLAATSMHGYLTIRVYTERLGLSQTMVVVELLACLILGYSVLVILLQHTGSRSKRASWLVAFAVCDLVVCAVLLGTITTLARAGLPVHCAGMTRSDFVPGDTPNHPPLGYTTIRFSDEGPGQRGVLDSLCGLDRSYYVIANALIFTYIFTVTATTLRILEKRYTRNTRVNDLIESLDRAGDINLKLMDTQSSLNESPSLNLPPPQPLSEGVLTRNPSLRSTFTAATSSAFSHASSYSTPPLPARPNHPPSIPRRPVPPTPASSATATTNHDITFHPIPLDEDPAEAALVADGMQHQPHPSHSHHIHSHHNSHPSHHHRQQPSRAFSRMSILSEEDQSAAEAALVSDGMAPSEPALPPYEPSPTGGRMPGHADESNEMRLSEYVKGRTRAQEMKDSGRY